MPRHRMITVQLWRRIRSRVWFLIRRPRLIRRLRLCLRLIRRLLLRRRLIRRLRLRLIRRRRPLIVSLRLLSCRLVSPLRRSLRLSMCRPPVRDWLTRVRTLSR